MAQPSIRRSQIEAAYQQYLGRTGSEEEYDYWIDNPDFLEGIKNSAEAQAYAKTHPATPPPAGEPQPKTQAEIRAAILATYQKYLGRPPRDEGEYQAWIGRPDYEEGIKNSDEAKAYATAHPGIDRPPWTGDPKNDPKWQDMLRQFQDELSKHPDLYGTGDWYAGSMYGTWAPQFQGGMTVEQALAQQAEDWKRRQTHPTPPPGSGGGGPGGPDDGGGFDPNSPLLKPWDQTFQGPSQDWQLPDLPQFHAPTYTPYADYVGLDPFSFPDFTPTTAADMQADPGYQFRRDQGADLISHSAAAKGLSRTGGTLKDLMQYGQDFASQEFGNVNTRRLTDWGTNYQHSAADYATNSANKFQAWNANRSNYGDTYDRAYQGALAEFAPRMTGYQTEAAAAQRKNELGYSRAWDDYMQKYNAWDQQRRFTYGVLSDQQRLGLQAIG